MPEEDHDEMLAGLEDFAARLDAMPPADPQVLQAEWDALSDDEKLFWKVAAEQSTLGKNKPK